ncbi:hypothetical protein NU219Hw_g427t1 [Hortaea werneckii]
MQISFGLLAVFGALFVEYVQAQSQFPEYWCRGFNQTGYYNQAYNQAWQDRGSSLLYNQLGRRISDAVICNSTNVITTGDKNGTCAIDAGGFFSTYAQANVSAGTGLAFNPNGTYFNTEASVRYTVSTMIDIEDADLFYRGGQEGAVREARYYINEGTNGMVNQTEAANLISLGYEHEEPRPGEAGLVKVGSLFTLTGGIVLFFALA